VLVTKPATRAAAPTAADAAAAAALLVVLVVKVRLPGVHCVQHADEHCADCERYQQHTCTAETRGQKASVVAVGPQSVCGKAVEGCSASEHCPDGERYHQHTCTAYAHKQLSSVR
jgi:hypothetical protein